MKRFLNVGGALIVGLIFILQPLAAFGQLTTPTVETTTTAPEPTATEPTSTAPVAPTVEPAPDTIPPTILSITAVSVDPTQVNIVWATDEASYGWVEFGPTSAYNASTTENGPSLEHIATLTGLTAGSEYHYRIASVDEDGNKTYSANQTFVTASEPVFVDETPPQITSVAIASTATSSATFSITTDELAVVQIEYGTTENYGSSTPPSEEFSVAQTATLVGLQPETTYHYRVIATDESGNSIASFDDTFITNSLPVIEIAPPPEEEPTSSGPIATPLTIIQPEAIALATSTVTIAWSTNKEADGRIDYGVTDAYGASVATSTQSLSHQFTLTGLSAGTAYVYKVTSQTASGETATVGELEFTTLPQVIAPVESAPALSGIAAQSVGTTTATIVWNTDTLADSLVRYGTTAGYEVGEVEDITLKNSHEISLTGLVPSTTYHFQVLSADVLKNAAISKDFVFTTASSSVAAQEVATGTESIASETVEVPIGTTTTLALPTSTTTSTVAELEKILEELEEEVTESTSSIPAIPDLTGTPNTNIPQAILNSITANGGAIPNLPPTPEIVKTEGLDGQVAFLWNSFGPTATTFQVRIVRSTSGSPEHENDGVVIYQGRGGAFTDTDVVNGETYHYAVYTLGSFRGISEPHLVSVTPMAGNEQVDLAAVPSEVQTTPTFTFASDLAPGAQNHDVEHLQLMLAQNPAIYPEGLVTGYFGPLTQSALTQFQTNNDLPATGIADAPTRIALEAASAKPSVIQSSPFSRDLSQGDQGNDVAALQTFLNDEGYYPQALFTGYFGSLTQTALIKFQQANNIQPANGYLGPITQHKIEDVVAAQGITL
ncbi:MAG TPA: fibronectin type III domain-containing protein [Candidatus Paceibacterota bacterium]|jgi:peptidoglycan hydrolase-like protein with peptidoglycan-binding domain/phosphodiesterase/alkaline phosphatase D-like protein|nr:fibronectin type III domain-containing protein [Candidatus Paceibacterota bacterium]